MQELIRRDPPAAPVLYEPRTQDIWIDQYLDEKETEVSRYVQIILRRRRLVASVALLVLAAAAAWSFTTERRYTSSVKLQIDPEQSVLPYRALNDAIMADPRYIGTQTQVLKSEALARRVVLALDPTIGPDAVTSAAKWFAANLLVTPVEGTQVVTVSYDSSDPVYAAKAINTLADEYVNYGFQAKQDSSTTARDFLEKELAKLRLKLEQSERQLVAYAREHSILLSADGNNVITEKLTDLNRELTRVEAEVLSNQYQTLQGTTLENFPEKLRTNVMKELDSRRSALEQKVATATAQFGPRWPEVQALRRELEDVRQQLATEQRKALEQAQVEYNLAVAHRERLLAALAAQSRLADQLTQDSIQFNVLKREVETDRQMHDGLLQRMKETDVSSGLKPANVHVLDRGSVPMVPSSPNIPLNLGLGLILGLMSGVALAVAAEFFDHTVKTPDDVELDLQLPCLGAIPAFDKSWKEASGGLLMPLNARGAHPSRAYLTTGDTYWESYRALRTSVLLSSSEAKSRTILIASAVPGEGKSTTTVNLGIALAQTGSRTVIVELDMRRPKLSSMLQISATLGLSHYLSGQCELSMVIHETGIPNLYLVPAGPVPGNPPELIGSPRMTGALELLSRHFQHVIIDGPPLLAVTDSLVISPRVSGVILVVQGSRTQKAAAQKARNLLKRAGANVLGTLMNNVETDTSELYYYGYSSGRSPYPARSDTSSSS